MIKCVSCGNLIEEDNEFCYFCGMDPYGNNSDEESSESARDNNKCFDYSLHGENPLYELNGNNGKSMIVYPHKCVIRTVASFSSARSGNATYCEKTIYFKDVIGVQFNKSGLLNGCLQLETASPNENYSRTLVDENSFSFEDNEKIYEAYKYIIHRLDEIKCI